MFLKVKIGHIWQIGRHPHLSKTARTVGPQIHELAIFFLKRTPFNSDYVIEKFANWFIVGRLAERPFFKTAPKMGP